MYPPGWRGPRGDKRKFDGSNANALVKSPTQEELVVASNLLFHQDSRKTCESSGKCTKQDRKSIINQTLITDTM